MGCKDARAVDNNLNYQAVFVDFFRPLWEFGVDVDMVDMEGELDAYSVVIAPLNYMYKRRMQKSPVIRKAGRLLYHNLLERGGG